MEVLLLQGGGHVAELRLIPGAGPTVNCLWEASWHTADPDDTDFHMLAEAYGSDPVGPFLASYTGHALCLDIFGPPSPEEASMRVPLHGEAAVQNWHLEPTADGCVARVALPSAQLEFERTVSLARGTSVLFVTERVENRNSQEREIHWVQHLSLGPPLLSAEHSSIYASLDQAMTWPLGYEGHELFRDNLAFEWPMALSVDGGKVNLETPFQYCGSGFVVAARVQPEREIAYIAVLNRKLGLALVYCFLRKDFPWIAIWEENCARPYAPWNGVTRVRGMEFGTTPMPIGRNAIRERGNLFETPGSRFIPSGSAVRARYIACIVQVPSSWSAIREILPTQDALILIGRDGNERVSVAATNLLDFLLKGRKEV